MLHAKLPASLNGQPQVRRHVGELIHEPLNDRLRDDRCPFTQHVLQHGYSHGLKIESLWAVPQREQRPARVYFSDANLLYIEPNTIAWRIQSDMKQYNAGWMSSPKYGLNNIIRMGMADYPFLPRAYTAINDKELLIFAHVDQCCTHFEYEGTSSQWVYLKAIEKRLRPASNR